jgi:hypothetical protein
MSENGIGMCWQSQIVVEQGIISESTFAQLRKDLLLGTKPISTRQLTPAFE